LQWRLPKPRGYNSPWKKSASQVPTCPVTNRQCSKERGGVEQVNGGRSIEEIKMKTCQLFTVKAAHNEEIKRVFNLSKKDKASCS